MQKKVMKSNRRKGKVYRNVQKLRRLKRNTRKIYKSSRKG